MLKVPEPDVPANEDDYAVSFIVGLKSPREVSMVEKSRTNIVNNY